MLGMRVVGGVRGLVGELHRDPEAVAVLRADFAHHLERADSGNVSEPARRREEVVFLGRSRAVPQIEGNRVADTCSVQSSHRAASVPPEPVPPTLSPLQEVLSVSNDVAAELAGVSDGVLDSLRDRLGCSIHLRGNRLTLDGDEQHVTEAKAVVDKLVDLVEGGHEIGPSTVDAVLGALDQAEDIRQVFDDVIWRHRGKKIAPKTVNQKRYVDAIRDHTITFAIGPAGTGKTYLAMALAVRALQEREVGRIILTRPAVEAGERLGFLPGDILAKVDPYLRPLYDALYDMLDADRLTAYMDKGAIEVAPLAFMRGRTLNDSFIILDEAQNTSPEQMQMFLTRLGFGSRVVVTGDATQIDLPREQGSGLLTVEEILGTIEGIEFVRFGHEDVVRHKIVQRIVEAYRLHTEESGQLRDRDRDR